MVLTFLALLAPVLLQQCSDKSTDTTDRTAPAAVADLAAGSASDTSLTLSWTAPGDDGTQGQAAQYNVRYYLRSITANNWDSAAPAGNVPDPAPAGTIEHLMIAGLLPDTTYYFAVRTADEMPNWSGLSNIAIGITLPVPDTIAPRRVSDLQVGDMSTTTVLLTWTAPGDDSATGTATVYDIRYAQYQITTENFLDADSVENAPTPSAAGTTENATISGLASNTAYYFAVRAGDESGNWSDVSNTDSVTTLPDPSSSWQRTYGTSSSDAARSVVAVDNEGFVMAGWTKATVSGNEDFYYMKVNTSSKFIWDGEFGGTGVDYAWSIVQAPDNGFAIAGLTYSTGAGNSDVQLTKIDQAGSHVWDKAYGGPGWEEGYAVKTTVDGGYILTGWSQTYGLRDLYLVKTNSSGDTLWTRKFGGAANETGYDVCRADQNGFVVVGGTESYGAGQQDVYRLRVADGGDSLWSRTYGGAGREFAASVVPSGTGGYLMAGATQSFGAGGYDVYAVMTDANGDSLWAEAFGGAGDDIAWAAAPTSDGGFVLVGETDSYGAGQKDVYLIKLDNSGSLLWQRTFGGPLGDAGYSVAPLSGGGFIVAGWTKSFGSGSADIYLIKVNDLGE
jgi:hypothetical protein